MPVTLSSALLTEALQWTEEHPLTIGTASQVATLRLFERDLKALCARYQYAMSPEGDTLDIYDQKDNRSPQLQQDYPAIGFITFAPQFEMSLQLAEYDMQYAAEVLADLVLNEPVL